MATTFDFTQDDGESLANFALKVSKEYTSYPPKHFNRLHIDKVHHDVTFSRSGDSGARLAVCLLPARDDTDLSDMDLASFITMVAGLSFGNDKLLFSEIGRYRRSITMDNSSGTPEVVAGF